jgi:hypothetical protein
VAKYLRDLDASDRGESSVHQPTSEELQKKIERLKERQQRYHGFVQEITASGETQLSPTDPDRRSMPKSPKVDVGYNVQIAVDCQHQLLVEQEVTKAVTDDEQLSPLALRAKETLGVERLRAVADMGDSHGHESKAGDTEQGYFLVKGLKNVRAEFRLSCLADNLTRVINILGVPRRLVALG